MEGPEELEVLVVDDYPDSAQCLAELVRLWGWSAASTLSGEEALRIASRTPPKVVILNPGMKSPSGSEVAHSLRRMPGTSQAAILALTGTTAGERPERSSKGFDAYLPKPADPDEVRRVLAGLLGPKIHPV